MTITKPLPVIALLFFAGCNNPESAKHSTNEPKQVPGSYGYDLALLQEKHKDAIVLYGKDTMQQLVVLPAFQGRIMTSTMSGRDGLSFGWINHDVIREGKPQPHMTAVGGEERFWLGPEGGQFALYFSKGKPFDFQYWQVPPAIDTEPFQVDSVGRHLARLHRDLTLTNYQGYPFTLHIERTIRMVDPGSIPGMPGMNAPGLRVMAFESHNSIRNDGKDAWKPETGLLSIWILSMFNANEESTIIIPHEADSTEGITSDYFGPIPADRLQVGKGYLTLKADGDQRGKLGLAPAVAKPFLGSYDAKNKVLTIVQYSLPEKETSYVNSKWELQKDPYGGDVVNAYNDGPIEGKQMGKFYELESSSPAKPLAPGALIRHIHRTIHIMGEPSALEKLSQEYLGVSLSSLNQIP
jgi:hypothetical protein